ncbi:BlaI/MecI/CopY family transcriptional regulator [Sunxiuqinia sp. A32]|uniref:BlaI/MecI/CopY family transcriptional regulator n=1 Tax=Sunxiuqinia sp. A32 TaxID=3461496 RepID=UPI004045EB7E
MKHLTNREEEIMEHFWHKGPLFVKEVVDLLASPKPHYNTISTIVRGLEEKGFLAHEQFGNTHRYYAKISLEEFSKTSINKIVKKYFDKSYASVVSMFVEEQEITTEEIKELIRQVEEQKNKKNE